MACQYLEQIWSSVSLESSKSEAPPGGKSVRELRVAMTRGQCSDADVASPRACRAGVLTIADPADSPVISRQAGEDGRVPVQCTKGCQQARSSLGQRWPEAALAPTCPWHSSATVGLLGRGTDVKVPGEVARKNKARCCKSRS